MPSKTSTATTQPASAEEKAIHHQDRHTAHAATSLTGLTAQPYPYTSHQILQLQKTLGNHAVTRLLPLMVQRTLDVAEADVDPDDLKAKIAARNNLSKWSQALQTAVDTLNAANTSVATAQELADAIVAEAKGGGGVAKTALKKIIEAYLKARQRREETAQRLLEKPPKILVPCSTERHIFPGATKMAAIKEGRTTIVKAEKYEADLSEINTALESVENGLADDSLQAHYSVVFVGTGYELMIDGTQYRWQPDHGMYPIGGTDTKSDAAAEQVIQENNW